MTDQEALYPFEFLVMGMPISLQGRARSKERWKAAVKEAAQDRVREADNVGFLDDRSLAVTIYYFPAASMEGDVDNIVKPIMDALVRVAYMDDMDDKDVERVVVQKFEPQVEWGFTDPSEQLAAALDTTPPMVYVRVDDDLSWRTV